MGGGSGGEGGYGHGFVTGSITYSGSLYNCNYASVCCCGPCCKEMDC